MSKLLFKLRNVPEDEADEVRALLSQNAIDFFETDAGNWGISMPGIWLSDELDFPRAKTLLEQYQHQRSANAREQYKKSIKAGNQTTIWDSLREKPLISIGLVIVCILVLYLSLKPFATLIQATH